MLKGSISGMLAAKSLFQFAVINLLHSLAWGCSGTQELHGRALSISFYLPDIAQSVYLRKFYPAREDSQIPILPLGMT